MAFLGDANTFLDIDAGYDPLDDLRDPFVSILDPNPMGSLVSLDGGSGLGLAALALMALFAMQQAAPASQGLGEGDEPVLAVKAWTVDGRTSAVPILADTLTREQLRQDCRHLPDVQKWTDDAAALLTERRSTVSASIWGSLVHGVVKRTIDALKTSFPLAYADLEAELSLSDDPTELVSYGRKFSTRLDVVEDRSEKLGAVSDYDIKTGREGLTPRRLQEIASRLALKYPGKIIYIIEVRPRL